MTRHPVSSSHLRSVGYDPGTMTLEIEFMDGGLNHYVAVPQGVYEALLRAASKGGFFHEHIEDEYRHRKVR